MRAWGDEPAGAWSGEVGLVLEGGRDQVAAEILRLFLAPDLDAPKTARPRPTSVERMAEGSGTAEIDGIGAVWSVPGVPEARVPSGPGMNPIEEANDPSGLAVVIGAEEETCRSVVRKGDSPEVAARAAPEPADAPAELEDPPTGPRYPDEAPRVVKSDDRGAGNGIDQSKVRARRLPLAEGFHSVRSEVLETLADVSEIDGVAAVEVEASIGGATGIMGTVG